MRATTERSAPVKLELRSGLVEVPGGLPTFASAGREARAESIGRIAADSYDYLADLLVRSSHSLPQAWLLASAGGVKGRTSPPLLRRLPGPPGPRRG